MKIYSLVSSFSLCLLSFVQVQATYTWKRDAVAVTTEKKVLSSLNEARAAHEKSVKEWWDAIYQQYGQSGNGLP